MLIIWGKKRVTKSLGYVADFCPLCRDVRAFELVRVGLAGHVYYLTLSEGELVGYERTCMQCRTVLNAQPDRYAHINYRAQPPGELAPITFPKLKEFWAARLGVERELKSVFGKVSPEDRQTLIREPFILLSPKVEEHYASSLAFVRGRFLRNEILPLLASALRPLKPTPAEIDAVLTEQKKLGRKIGSKVKAVDVLAALAASPAGELPGAVKAA
jgi:hypothetical protein